jgi:uncharacterized membrane protein (GlpM family)
VRTRHRDQVVGISVRDVLATPRKDLWIRFAFGAAISATAAVIGLLAGERAGGLLLAFPAILPATLTLIEKEESRRKARDDDVGAIMGATALAAFAAVAWWLLPRVGAAVALTAASAAWLVGALALYAISAVARSAGSRHG